MGKGETSGIPKIPERNQQTRAAHHAILEGRSEEMRRVRAELDVARLTRGAKGELLRWQALCTARRGRERAHGHGYVDVDTLTRPSACGKRRAASAQARAAQQALVAAE